MVDLYESIKKNADMNYINGIYRGTNSSDMEGLLDDLSKTKFPCILMEIGDDGFLNLLDSARDTRNFTFLILESDSMADASKIDQMLYRTKKCGKEMLYRIREQAHEYGDDWYGVDFSRIEYFKVGCLGLGSYGYCFNLTIVDYGE